MTSSSNLIPFSLDHLLLAGLVIDRGQLTPNHRAELKRRTLAGLLVNEMWVTPQHVTELWRLPGVRTPEKLLP